MNMHGRREACTAGLPGRHGCMGLGNTCLVEDGEVQVGGHVPLVHLDRAGGRTRLSP